MPDRSTEIAALYLSGAQLKDICRLTGACMSVIYDALRRERVPLGGHARGPQATQVADPREVCRLAAEGHGPTEIGRRLGISRQRAHQIVSRYKRTQ